LLDGVRVAEVLFETAQFHLFRVEPRVFDDLRTLGTDDRDQTRILGGEVAFDLVE